MRTSWTLFFVFLFLFWQLWNKLVPLTEIATFIGTAWISVTLSYRLSRFVWHKAFVTRVHGGGKAVLITGCDTGFGHRLAKRLAREGFLVFAGCLSSSSDGAKELKTLSNMRVLQLDVTKQDEVNAALETVKKNLSTTVLWSVVANAGIGNLGFLEWVTTDTVLKTFDVNVFGVLRVIKAFLPLLKKSRGRVVTVASPLGRFTMPMVAPYCMSKHSVVSMMDAFRRECSGRGVDFITVEPGFHRTPMITKNSTSTELILKEFQQQSPEVIADYSHDDIEELVKASIKSFETCMRDNPEEAVDVLENAVRETYPKTAYTSSLSLDVAFQTFITSVSSELADIVISITRNLSVWLNKPLK